MLIISEKPSVARKITVFLSNGKFKYYKTGRYVGYYVFYRNGEKIVVTHALGHLFTLSDEKKTWTYPTFSYKWVPAYIEDKIFVKKKVIETIRKFRNENTVVIATDYDIEGELIGYNILRFVLNKTKAKRMKFSAITKQDILNAFYNLIDINYPFAVAGETRHIVDWIYGINLSRALTLAVRKYIKGVVLSIGRVQGPTLKIVFEREKEIRNFIPEEFYTLKAIVLKENTHIEFKHPEKFKNKKEAEDVKKKIRSYITVKNITSKKEKISPPHPYNLTDLQTDAYKYYKLSPKQVLDIAQKLYEKGYISYPRTSSQKLPPTIDFKYIISQLSKSLSYKKFAGILLSKKILTPNNGKKDDVHPAIHPTGILPSELSKKEFLIYDLVVRRFLSTFMDSMLVENFLIQSNEGLEFKYKKVLDLGWGIVYYKWIKDDFYNFEFEKGEKLKVVKVQVRKQKTKPPSRYNPASLVKKMEEVNIGTKATRADIVAILYKRGYITGRSIQVTELGEEIINIFDKYMPEILDIVTTRRLEDKLERIEKGDVEYSKEVIDEAKNIILNVSEKLKAKEEEIGKKLVELYKKINST